jgi:hypothetical protein
MRPLAALSAVVVSGCLDEPPTYAPRGQIPPFILTGRVDPPVGAIYDGETPIPINVPFRSEDVNVPLLARLYMDLPPGAARGLVEEEVEVAAGIFEDLSRSVVMEWTRRAEGCHSLTLILTYVDNDDVSQLPRDDTRAARVVWWLNIDDADDMVRMSDCPGANQDDSPVPSVP